MVEISPEYAAHKDFRDEGIFIHHPEKTYSWRKAYWKEARKIEHNLMENGSWL